jgi:hypothetical protein
MSSQRFSLSLRFLMLLLSPAMLAQQSTSTTALNELGRENAAMAQRVGENGSIHLTFEPFAIPTASTIFGPQCHQQHR